MKLDWEKNEDGCCVADEVMSDLSENASSNDLHTFHFGVSKTVSDIMLRSRYGEFGKFVHEKIRSISDSDVSAILEFPVNDGDYRILFFYLFGSVACGANYSFCGNKCDFGDGDTILTDFKCDMEKTVINLSKEFGDDFYVTQIDCGGFHENVTFFCVLKGGVIFDVRRFGITIMYDATKVDLVKKIFKCMVGMAADEDRSVDYVVYDRCFHTTDLKVRKQECDIGMNYNDDLPDDKIREWINSDESGLMILHGDPGTGKTSYIRNLIYRTDNRFMFFDKSLFQHMSDASLIQMLLEHRNSIIVLEDCEDLLTDRTGLGSCMTTILNLTDGILGDSLRFKFICTFNADLVDIDSAILRKGRMRLKYEFKKLTADKAVALGKKLGVEVPHEEMPLCEVYNYTEDNGGKVEEKAKVGF